MNQVRRLFKYKLIFGDIEVVTWAASTTVAPVVERDPTSNTARAPIFDEDPLDEIVADSNALAEVKLPVRRSKFFLAVHWHTHSKEL